MDKIYCGIGDVPKGKRKGTMKECALAGQVRLFGISKIDKRTLQSAQGERKQTQSQLALMKIYAGSNGKIRKIQSNLPYEKDEKKKASMMKDIDKIKKVRDDAVAKLIVMRKNNK